MQLASHRNLLQGWKLGLPLVLNFQEFLSDEESAANLFEQGRQRRSVSLCGFESIFVNSQALDFGVERPRGET